MRFQFSHGEGKDGANKVNRRACHNELQCATVPHFDISFIKENSCQLQLIMAGSASKEQNQVEVHPSHL